jgi:5'-AMP-activated protein kinase regulatory gamma subunit
MMTVTDFIHATRAYRSHHRPVQELTGKTIEDMLTDGICRLQFYEFQSIDAEDTVLQACGLIRRLGCDYIPVLDPDEGNLLATIGYFDILLLIIETARTHEHLFNVPLSVVRIGSFDNVITVPRSALLLDVLSILDERNISAVPVTDETGRVIGLYHRADVTFLATAVDMESNMSNLELSVGDILEQQQEQTSQSRLCTCSPSDTLLQVLRSCAEMRCSRLVSVDEDNHCVGVISVKDLVSFFM